MILSFLAIIMFLYLIVDVATVVSDLYIGDYSMTVIVLLRLFPVILALILLGSLETLP